MTQYELTAEETQQAVFVRELLAASPDFRPFAVFDAPLDCIRVGWRDCSVTEIRINDLLTVLEANYPSVPGASEIVGFSIKGVGTMAAGRLYRRGPNRLRTARASDREEHREADGAGSQSGRG
jgi:hypothetical protein